VTAGFVLPANAQPPVTDMAMDAIVNGPTRASKSSKSLVAKVVNEGTSTVEICNFDISWDITVNGTLTTGQVSAINTDCELLGPGDSMRFRFNWVYGTGEVGVGAEIHYAATVDAAEDFNLANNTDTEIRVAT
jgi:hypothetical protein